MTARQEEYLLLWEKGYGVCEIARMLGKSKNTVSTGLKRARRPKKPSQAVSKVCPYSPTCFNCPLADCTVPGATVNMLPLDYEIARDVLVCG